MLLPENSAVQCARCDCALSVAVEVKVARHNGADSSVENSLAGCLEPKRLKLPDPLITSSNRRGDPIYPCFFNGDNVAAGYAKLHEQSIAGPVGGSLLRHRSHSGHTW